MQDREISGTLFEAKALVEHWRQSSGAVREVAGKFGCRRVVLRDCATAYEFPNTYGGRYVSRAHVRLIATGPKEMKRLKLSELHRRLRDLPC